MAKFNLSTGKNFFIGGVLKSFQVGEYETTDKAELEALKNAKGVQEIKAKASKPKAEE